MASNGKKEQRNDRRENAQMGTLPYPTHSNESVDF